MAQDDARGPIEAALAETHFSSLDDGEGHFRVRWPSGEVLVTTDVELSDDGALPRSNGDAGYDVLELDHLLHRTGSDAEPGVLANPAEKDSVDSGMAWVDITDGWAL